MGRTGARIAKKNLENERNYEKKVKTKYEKKRSAQFFEKKDRNDDLAYCPEPTRILKRLTIEQKCELADKELETPKPKRKNKSSKTKLFENSKK